MPVEGYADVAASMQYSMMTYITYLAERAMLYTNRIYPDVRHIVVSGGVASNSLLRELLAEAINRQSLPLSLIAPEPRLCTDNGTMIAWAGVEYLKAGIAPMAQSEVERIHFMPRLPIGEDISDKVQSAGIKVRRPKAQH